MERTLRWFLPPDLRSVASDAARRALSLVATSLGCAAIGLAVALLDFVFGVRASAAVEAACAVLVGAMAPLVRVTGAVRPIGWAMCAAIWCAALAIAVGTDAALAAPLFYLALMPALATLAIGWRAGLLWAGASFAALAALLALHAAGHWSSLAVDPDVARASAIRGAIVVDVLLVLFAGGYEWLRGAALRRAVVSEQRYQALAAHGSDLIAEADAKGRIVFASPNHDAFGVPVEAMIGRPSMQNLHPDDRDLILAAARSLAHDRVARSKPVRARLRDGEWRWFETSLTSYRTPEGEPRVIGVSRDVTERLALETQLRQSQKMEAVGQLAGGAAHDFNNLLMVIAGYAEQLALAHPAGSEERVAAEEILRAAERGADVTRRLLALGRPAGEQREVVDLNAMVAAIEPMLRRLIGGGDVAVELALAPERPCVLASAGALEQVLLNLALNARDAMSAGGRLRIETRLRGDRVELAVSDTGTGMDDATRERVFEPFFTTKPDGVGTGLGLYVVHTIVERLGGAIAIESEPGVGTRVAVELPPTSDRPASEPSLGRDAEARGDETILVAEDRPEIAALLRKALERAGHRVVLARDGIEALERVSLDPSIALVVSDVVMPRMGGFELIASLARERPGLPVLLMSGHPNGAATTSPQIEQVMLLAKPFSLDELRRRVRVLLDARA